MYDIVIELYFANVDIFYLKEAIIINDSENKINLGALTEQFASTNLPPYFKHFFSRSSNLIQKIKEDSVSSYCYFKKNNQKNVYTVDKNNVNIPKYIYHKGAESIKYFAYKKDASLRPMGIANPIWFFSFLVNILFAGDEWLQDLYSLNNQIIQHSNSPILGKSEKNLLKYDDFGIPTITVNSVGILNEVNTKSSDAFKRNKRKTALVEGTNPIYLKTDFESFYENIYTHRLGNLWDRNPYSKKSRLFFEFLDEYNMAVNDNHTKGILQGPISSRISAELFSIAIDSDIIEMQKKNNMIIEYVRYVDDYTFYSDEVSKLERQIEDFDRVLRRVGITRKVEKTKIQRGFVYDKSADLQEIFLRFSFLFNKNLKIPASFFNIFRDYMKSLLEEENIPQIKALLTILTNFFKQIKSTDKNLSKDIVMKIEVFLLPFLLKVVYIKPILCPNIYRLIFAIGNTFTLKGKKSLAILINDDTRYIFEHFRSTEVQIWHYYLLTQFAAPQLRKKIMHDFIKRSSLDNDSSDPLILLGFVQNDFNENHKIFEMIKKIYKKDQGITARGTFLDGIGSSRWWPVIIQLYLAYKNTNNRLRTTKSKRNFNRDKNQLEGLFKTNAGDPNYRELGIFIHLLP